MAVGELQGRPIVVSGSSDSTVRVWDRGTGNPVGDPFTRHTDQITAVAVGEVDGRPVVVSGSRDRTVRVRDPRHRPESACDSARRRGSIGDEA